MGSWLRDNRRWPRLAGPSAITRKPGGLRTISGIPSHILRAISGAFASSSGAVSMFTIQRVVSGGNLDIGDCHGNKKLLPAAPTAALCSRTLLHAAGFLRHRCDHQHGRVARLRAAIGNLSFTSPAMGQPGATHEKRNRMHSIRTTMPVNNFEFDPGPAAARRSIRINGLPKLAGDKHSTFARNNMMSRLQGSHRRCSLQNRTAQ